MSAKVNPVYPINGNLRMYNMFPFRRYTEEAIGIDDMTAYIPEVAAMGYNAVWVPPLQATGTLPRPHPDPALTTNVSGSLYAMADDRAFNPLIFPGDLTQEQCEEKLKKWTASVRLHGMFPLFDLPLNHVGRAINGQFTPLQRKLGSDLLLDSSDERWVDTQNIDYFRTGAKTHHGVNTEPKDLDVDKIDAVFETLWAPFITRYILEYGFMGMRVDAITHVPLAVQQRAIHLVQGLVRTKFGTDAFIVGELMVADPKVYHTALSSCGFTHCLHPCGFYWGHNIEGGYHNTDDKSPFVKQNKELSTIVLSPSELIDMKSYTQLLIDVDKFDHTQKLLAKTIYIFNSKGVPCFVLNDDATDICFGKAVFAPIASLEEAVDLLRLLTDYRQALQLPATVKQKATQRASKNSIITTMQLSSSLTALRENGHVQVNRGGLVGVVGNHDVGTLKAKVMLDIARSIAMNNAGTDGGRGHKVDVMYDQYKDLIKGIKNTGHLITILQMDFGLNDAQKTQLFLDVNLRMREKIFIQAMMCLGGWYSLAGDEVGMCHKPEVFEQFARDSARVGSSIKERYTSREHQHDLRGFISGINKMLSTLPRATSADKVSMHYVVLENEEYGVRAAKFLFMVSRYSAVEDKYYFMAHADALLSDEHLQEKMMQVFAQDPCLQAENGGLQLVDKLGKVVKIRVESEVHLRLTRIASLSPADAVAEGSAAPTDLQRASSSRYTTFSTKTPTPSVDHGTGDDPESVVHGARLFCRLCNVAK